ncbi:Hypothetical protein UVM_LOCUS462 [uncultured virus]|nr:Hypothetical protein UVM_LOCUS462 [uncultured virus]
MAGQLHLTEVALETAEELQRAEQAEQASKSSAMDWMRDRIDDAKEWFTFWRAVAVGSAACVVLVASVVMLVYSFSYVEWNEFALKKNTASNTVDYEHVYDNGRYFWGLGRSPVRFDNTLKTVRFGDSGDAIVVFSEGGLELQIACGFQYRVIREELGQLYREYGMTYAVQIESISLSILKNVAPAFTMQDYYQNRSEIRAAMFAALATGLREKMHVEAVSFQLDFVKLPGLVLGKLLNIAVQNQTNIREQYVQEAAVVRQETTSMAQVLLASASVINQTALANAGFVRANARAQAFLLVQNEKRAGLQVLFEALGLNTTELRLSFVYVTSLTTEGGGRAADHMLVDIEQVLLGNGK